MDRTLLLDQSYQPLTTIGWQRAVSLLFCGKIEIIEEYDKEVRSVSLAIKMPAVVRLIDRFRKGKQRVKLSKQNVFARDRWTCQYCGKKKATPELTRDHVVPRAQGGRTEWTNLVTSCKACNHLKADRTPSQAGMALRSRPTRPDWVPVFIIQLGHSSMPAAWQPYVAASAS